MMYVQLLSLPTLGSLHYANGSRILSAGAILPVPLTSAVAAATAAAAPTTGLPSDAGAKVKAVVVQYLGARGYFSFPTTTAGGNTLVLPPDSFMYRVVTEQGAVSVGGMQCVHIRNVNDPTALTYSYKYQNKKSTSDSVIGSPGNNFNGGRSNSSKENNAKVSAITIEIGHSAGGFLQGEVELQGFEVSDPDLGLDLIHVQLRTLHGVSKLSLNPDSLPLLDFSSLLNCFYSAWACTGDGADDEFMSFVGAPAAVQSALNGMRIYTVGVPTSMEDVLTIALYDGQVRKEN
jgi:hypothetical protein